MLMGQTKRLCHLHYLILQEQEHWQKHHIGFHETGTLSKSLRRISQTLELFLKHHVGFSKHWNIAKNITSDSLNTGTLAKTLRRISKTLEHCQKIPRRIL